MPLCLDNMAGAKRKNWNRGRHASLASNAMHHEVGNLRGSCNRIQLYIYIYLYIYVKFCKADKISLSVFCRGTACRFVWIAAGRPCLGGNPQKFARGVRMLKM